MKRVPRSPACGRPLIRGPQSPEIAIGGPSHERSPGRHGVSANRRVPRRRACAVPFQKPTGLADGLEPESALGGVFTSIPAPLSDESDAGRRSHRPIGFPAPGPHGPSLGGHIEH